MSWERIWGPTEALVVDGETGAVYATPKPGAGPTPGVHRWDGTPFGWRSLGGSAVSLVTAGRAPRSAVFGLDAQGVVSRYDEAAGVWTSLDAPGGRASAIYGGPDQLLAVAAEGSPDVYRWDADDEQWTRIGGPGKKFVVGRSSDPEFPLQVYGLSPDDAPAATKGVYQWRGQWYKEGGPAGDIFVSGTQLFATDPTSGDVLTKAPTGWQRIGGPGKQFAPDHAGHVYALTPGGEAVYRWRGTPNSWQQVGGAASAIFAGWDRLLFALDPTTADLWFFRPACPAPGPLPAFEGVIRTEKMANRLGGRKLLLSLWDPVRPAHPRPTRQQVEAVVFGPRPSLADWVHENSHGRAHLVSSGVFGWYDAPAAKQGDHYWDNPNPASPDPAKHSPTYHLEKYGCGWLTGHTEKWADAAVRAAQETDLAAHDANHDGTLTQDELGLFLCYPQNTPDGFGRKPAGQQHPTWKPLVLDGVEIPQIVEWYLGAPPHFGTGMHELAHLVLDTPDMYFDTHWPWAAGGYSISDQANGQHLSAPEKLKLGWLEYKVVTQDGTYPLPDVETTGAALVVMNPERGPDEYFVLENRWRGTSYDAGGPGIGPGIAADGLAVWHVIEDPALIDSSPSPPGAEHQWGRLGVRMIRANGGLVFDDHKALFSTKGAVVSDVTRPAHLHWLGDRPSGVRIKLLTGAGPTMTLEIGVSCP